jgi:hypothetical protein
MKLEHTIIINIKNKKLVDEIKKQTKCPQCEIDFLKKNYTNKENNKQNKEDLIGEHK